MIRSVLTAAAVAAALFLPAPTQAQAPPANKDFFVPPQAQPRPAAPPAAQAPRPAQSTRPTQPPPGTQQGGDDGPMVQIPMPPVPELAALPKGASPPAAVQGVIGVPDVMRISIAAQAVDRTLGERREKLNDDAQKEQDTWRAMQQALANDRAKLTPEQVRAREKELNDRISNAQRQFRDRNRILQEQTQFALNAIQASLIAVIRQVAESRGMNMVLHRAQVALNVNEFDITDQVAEQLNKVLPIVLVPADGVSPVPQTATGPGGPAQPAAAPGPGPRR